METPDVAIWHGEFSIVPLLKLDEDCNHSYDNSHGSDINYKRQKILQIKDIGDEAKHPQIDKIALMLSKEMKFNKMQLNARFMRIQ